MPEPQDLNDENLRSRAVRAAMGEEKFDVLIVGGQIADMVTGQLRKADIGLIGPLIASVHPTDTRDDADEVFDANGAIVSPGLIDMHMHIESSMITPETYADTILPRGVTTIVWDPHELANTCALTGMDYALDAARRAPLRNLTLAPSCVPSAPGFETTGADFTPDILQDLLARAEIHGVAEVMSMSAVIERDPRITGIVQAGLASGKRVCGHARGLSGASLNAYAAAGIGTDHELTSGEDLLAKLEAGLTIELRGSHDHLLPVFVKTLNTLGQMPQTLTLCTDDVFADDLNERGGLDDVLRRLATYGLDPFKALQAATLNAATRLGRNDLGLIAPGRRADIVLFDNLTDFRANTVIANGQRVAVDQKILQPTSPTPLPDVLLNTMKTDPVSAGDFRIQASGQRAVLNTIERPRFPEWGNREVAVKNGHAQCPSDMTRMAVLNRFGARTPPRIAFLGQWGSWRGAFATTVSHDAHNLTVFGGDEENMAIAANTVMDMGGGLAVVSDGKVLARLPLPVAGLLSAAPLADVARGFRDIRAAMAKIVDWQPPYLVFKACFGASLVCNAGPHLSDVGIVDSVNKRILINSANSSDQISTPGR